MNDFIKLSASPDKDNNVDLIVNKTKRNYLNLQGVNPPEAIKCLRDFLVKYHVWAMTDIVVHTKKHKNFVPDQTAYHDISFMITFYDLACISKETREKMLTEETQQSKTEEPTQISTEIPAETYQYIVKYLTKTPVGPENSLVCKKDQLIEELKSIIASNEKSKNELIDESEEIKIIPVTTEKKDTKSKGSTSSSSDSKETPSNKKSKISYDQASSSSEPPKKTTKLAIKKTQNSSDTPKKIAKPVTKILRKPPLKTINKVTSESVESDSDNNLDESSDSTSSTTPVKKQTPKKIITLSDSTTPVKKQPPKKIITKGNIKVVDKKPPIKRTK